jgi:hypothetical protein
MDREERLHLSTFCMSISDTIVDSFLGERLG